MTTDERSASASEPDFFANAAAAGSSSATGSVRTGTARKRRATPTSRAKAGSRRTAITGPNKSPVIVVDQVVETSTLAELRKPPETITIRNIGAGEISLLQRKAFNSLLQFAQQGKDAERLTFEVDVRDFERMVGHTSTGNREYLRTVARSLVAVQVEFDYQAKKTRAPGWGVGALIAEVFIEGDVIRYSLAPEMSKKLLNPEVYSRIDLQRQAKFKTYASLVLWEITSRYYGWEQSETARNSWQWWSVNLSGANAPHDEFRDFNKVLDRAIKIVNEFEDRFQIQPVVTRRGKKIDEIWFELTPKKQTRLALPDAAADVSSELVERLASFGIEAAEVAELVVKHGEDYLHAQADYLDKRMARKNAAKIASPRNFYLSCAEKNYGDAPLAAANPVKRASTTSKAKPAVNQSAQATLDGIYAKLVAAECAKLKERFEALTAEEQEEIVHTVREDLRQNKVIWEQYKKSGLTRSVVSEVIRLSYLKNSKRPDDTELYKYAVENGLLLAAA